MPDLLAYFDTAVWLGLLQAGGAIILCGAVVLLYRYHHVHVAREAVVSLLRGLVQMVFVGFVLALLLHGNLLIGALILLAMAGAAAATAAKRSKGLGGSFALSFVSIAAGGGLVIATMIALGALKTDIQMLVPVGSMIIANAMNACAQAAERFRADVVAHAGPIEAGLALGAEPSVAVAPYVRSAVYACLLPRLDMMKSLGLVWIPGVMAGMMLNGANPLTAGLYQFVIVAMIMSSSGITGLVAVLLLRSRAFSPAAQLLLRPGRA